MRDGRARQGQARVRHARKANYREHRERRDVPRRQCNFRASHGIGPTDVGVGGVVRDGRGRQGQARVKHARKANYREHRERRDVPRRQCNFRASHGIGPRDVGVGGVVRDGRGSQRQARVKHARKANYREHRERRDVPSRQCNFRASHRVGEGCRRWWGREGREGETSRAPTGYDDGGVVRDGRASHRRAPTGFDGEQSRF